MPKQMWHPARWTKTFIVALALNLPTANFALGAEPAEKPDFQFAVFRYPGGNPNPRPEGLPRLAWEVRKRTSIAAELTVTQVGASDPNLFEYPLIVWQGDGGFPSLSRQARSRIREHVRVGGTWIVDISDGSNGTGFDLAVRRELKAIFPQDPLQRVPPEHVVYKSFYLLNRHGGRVSNRSYLEGIAVDGRLAVILYSNDLAGAVARDAYGEWSYTVDEGGNAAREASFRMGINFVMYALCLDYKDDQVHLPFILRRRR